MNIIAILIMSLEVPWMIVFTAWRSAALNFLESADLISGK
jgi:hypothetical protein